MKEEEEKKAKKDIVDFEKKSKLIHGLYTSVFFSLYVEIEWRLDDKLGGNMCLIFKRYFPFGLTMTENMEANKNLIPKERFPTKNFVPFFSVCVSGLFYRFVSG